VTPRVGARPVRATVLEKPGAPLRVENLLLDPPADGEVLVRLEASGVCHSDLRLAEGEWGESGPIVLGHEGCGVVEEVGSGVDPALRGRRVVLNWFAPCLACAACQRGRQWECSGTLALSNRLPDGSTRLHREGGEEVLPYLGLATFGEATVVPAVAAVPVPDGIDPAVAALIGCCVSTGVGAVLKTAEVRPGAVVAVYGLGGVGLSVVMGAALAGAGTIVAVDRTAEKLERATAVGATVGVIASDDDEETRTAVVEATGGGAEFAFEAIGMQRTIELTISSVRTGGTAVLVGMTPFGVRASFDAFEVVDRSVRILGSNYGFAVGSLDFPRYAGLHLAGRLPVEHLVERRISLDDVEDAFEAMRRGEGARRVIEYPNGSAPA
jgi:S-(hydroxymethyl)glutathione dehydrogenase / alcohol dehydrogenase